MDEWRLAEWAELFDADGEYWIPPGEVPDGDTSTTLFMVYGDRHKRNAHAEFPRSWVQHMIANVQVEGTGDELVRVRCTFLVHRSRGDGLDIFWPCHLRPACERRQVHPHS